MGRTVMSAEQLKYVQKQKDMELASAHRKVKPYLKALENSSLAKFRSLTDQDVINLAHRFATMDNFIEMCTANASLNELGRLPIIKYEYLTYDYGESMTNIVTSTQTVDEPSGDVLYKQIVAIDTAGDVQAGQSLLNAKKAPDSWQVKNFGINGLVASTTTVAGTTQYTFEPDFALLKNAVAVQTDIELNGVPVSGRDDGYGHIAGYGLGASTVDYEEGTIVIKLANSPEAGKTINVFFSHNVEEDGKIPAFTMGLNRLPISCDTIALAGEFGIFQDFAIFKKIGKGCDADIIQDLTNMVNMQMFNRLMLGGTSMVKVGNALKSGVINCVPESHALTWYRAPHTANNYYSLQAPEITRKISQLDGLIQQDMGRGSANVLVAGTNVIADLEFLPDFEPIEVGSYGAKIKGKYRNRIVISNPAQDKDTIFGWYKGTQDFDCATYSATYMPITMSDMLVGRGGNLAKRARVIATWANAGVTVPEGLVSLNVADAPEQEPST